MGNAAASGAYLKLMCVAFSGGLFKPHFIPGVSVAAVCQGYLEQFGFRKIWPKVAGNFHAYMKSKGLRKGLPVSDIGLSFADTNAESSDSDLEDLVKTASTQRV